MLAMVASDEAVENHAAMSRFPVSAALRYLLVSHIPFMRTDEGDISLDHLWARDLEGLSSVIGPVPAVARELPPGTSLASWGPTSTTLSSKGPLSFTGLLTVASRRDGWKWLRIRAILRAEVDQADLVHSSNLFPSYVGLSYAHDHATRLGKKTIFVIAEDFYDMLAWEWVRLGATGFERWQRHRVLVTLNARVRKSAAHASLTFLHTPAAVERYRLSTRCGLAIRQPEHEHEEVISDSALAEKCAASGQGVRLVIITACRHKPLNGLDFLIDAVALLAAQNSRVEVRFYGDGDSTPQLRAQVARRHLTNRVSFPGALAPGPSIYEAKGLIEPHNLAIPFAKRLVFLMFIISIVSVYEFKMGVTPWKLVLQRFFLWQGEGWVTTFRWGFARVAGPYGHAILAGVMLITVYRIQRWLEWSQQWEPRFRNGSGLPVSKARMITIGLVLGVLMTMVRGPWIAGILAAVLTSIGRAKNRWRAVGIIGAAMVVIGTPTVIAFKSYVSVGRERATSVAQESAAYRKELMDKYIDIALERSIWSWGRTTWPKIPGMPSIDNYYLLLALMHGVLALGFLLLIFLMMMTAFSSIQCDRHLLSPVGAALVSPCWASTWLSGSRSPRSTWEGRSSRSSSS